MASSFEYDKNMLFVWQKGHSQVDFGSSRWTWKKSSKTCQRKICKQPAAHSRSDPHWLNSMTQSNTFPEDPRGKRRPPLRVHLYTSSSAARYSVWLEKQDELIRKEQKDDELIVINLLRKRMKKNRTFNLKNTHPQSVHSDPQQTCVCRRSDTCDNEYFKNIYETFMNI